MIVTLFSLFLLPISVLIFYLQNDKSNREHFLLVIFLGAFAGSLFLTYKILFPALAFTFTTNFLMNFLYLLFMQVILPIFVPYLILYIFSKDTIKDKVSYFFPFTASFYAVFLPYLVLEAEKPYTGFLLFIKPLLILSLLIFTHIWLYKYTSNNVKSISITITNFVFLIIAICMPSIMEAIWITNFSFFTWLIPSLIFFILVAILIVPKSTIKD